MAKRPVAYGQTNEIRSVHEFPAAASQPFQADAGKWMCINSSYAYLLSTGSATNIIGWAEVGTFSSSSTAGADIISVNVANDGEYEMPMATASFTEAQLKAKLGCLCDIETSSAKQYIDPDTATYKLFQIVGYKYYGPALGEQSLIVRKHISSMQSYSSVS